MEVGVDAASTLEPGRGLRPPPRAAWIGSLVCFVIGGVIVGLARNWGSGPGWPGGELIAAWLLSLCTGIAAAVNVIRMFFRTRGAARKLAVLGISLVALPLHLLLDRVGSAPISDGALIDGFHARRPEFDQRPEGGWAMITEWRAHGHITVSGWAKGYLYTETTPTPLVGSLDLSWLGLYGRPRPAYRRIEGNWYLYLD